MKSLVSFTGRKVKHSKIKSFAEDYPSRWEKNQYSNTSCMTSGSLLPHLALLPLNHTYPGKSDSRSTPVVRNQFPLPISQNWHIGNLQ
jgi:hypothetical protein